MKGFDTSKLVVGIIGAVLAVVWVMRTFRAPSPPAESGPQALTSAGNNPPVVQAGKAPGVAQQVEQLSERRRTGWSQHEIERGQGDQQGEMASQHRRQGVMKGPAAPQTADESSDDQTSLENQQEFESIKQTLLHNDDPEERMNALTSLNAFDDELALPVLTGALSDANAEVRLTALQALETLTVDVPFDTFANALSDSDPEVRSEALRIVATSDDDRAQSLIRQALNDPDEDVRTFAELYADEEPDHSDATP